MFEFELKELCTKFIEALDELRSMDLISEEELKEYSKEKLKFIESLNLQ